MSERRRLTIARVSYEGNSFNPLVTGRARLERREWVAGEVARAFYAGRGQEELAARFCPFSKTATARLRRGVLDSGPAAEA